MTSDGGKGQKRYFAPGDLTLPELIRARDLLREGWDLRQVSDVTGLPMRDIDLALWRLIGHGATILPPDPETPAGAP